MEHGCDLLKMERTNMVSKMEDRIKVDLVLMSKQILDHLRQCDPGSLGYTTEKLKRIAVQFNQGALVQYQYGEIEKAEILCRGEIELFAQLSSDSTQRALCLASMIAPYINLARIYGQKGEVRESISIFEDIYRFGMQEHDLLVFGHRINVSHAPAIFEASPGLQKVMVSCRIVEATRVLQMIEDYSALLKLADTNAGRPEYQDVFFKQFLLEVRSRALLNLGQYEGALTALEECCNLMPSNTADRLSAYLLLVQLYREWGHYDLATTTLNKLEEHLGTLASYGKRLPILRQIAYRIALERHTLGDNSGALSPAEKAFSWCSELNDQPGSIKTAILLLRICTDSAVITNAAAMMRRWYEELQQLASITLFRLERACAYWELALSADLLALDEEKERKICQFLQNSYNLYRTIPFIDSKLGSEIVKRSLESRLRQFPSPPVLVTEVSKGNSSSIDSLFDVLMMHVPKSFVASQ